MSLYHSVLLLCCKLTSKVQLLALEKLYCVESTILFAVFNVSSVTQRNATPGSE